MKSHTFDLNDIQIMSSDEALLINGGMILSDPSAFWNTTSQAMQYISEGWSSFCAGFNDGYEKHRK